MLSFVVNVVLVLLLLFLLYIGYYAGIIKSFFAVSAGFFAILLAERYPYQIGINYYFVFVATALIIFLIGLFVFRVVKFLYLSLFDKLTGAVLGFVLWFIISANVVIPVFNKSVETLETKTGDYISDLSSKVFPSFGKYVPEFIYDKKLENSKDYILWKKEKKEL